MVPHGTPLVALVTWLLASARASTVDCSYALITSAADAELVGKNCPTVNGNITFATSESVNLDGVQVIEGNISNSQAVYECDWENRIHGPCNSTGPFTISMPSLTTVHGNLHFEGYLDLANLSLPKLTQINQFFLDSVYNLTYMDITELDTLSSFSIDRTRRLATMRHTGLRNYTGQPLNYFNTLWISDTSLDSVDSIFSNPFNLSGIPQSWAFVGFDMMPNLRRATFGIASADYVRLGGGNVTITFGGPTTRTMDLDTIDLSGGVGGFERHPNLQNISVGVISTPIGNNNFTSLSLPFDQLGKLDLQGETKVQQISNLPQAVSWTNFTLSITLCDALNLSSQSEPNAAGQLGQTWYWPQTDMESVAIEGGYFTENFFKTFLDYESINASSAYHPKVSELILLPNAEGMRVLNCTPFDLLRAQGIITNSYTCYSTKKSLGNNLLPRLVRSWGAAWTASCIVFSIL